MGLKEGLASIGVLLPEAEVRVLEHHAEKQLEAEFYTRWMSSEERVDLLEAIAKIPVYRDIAPLWEDGGSDYIAIYRSGPLAGKVCVMFHEETDLAPRWRSVMSFVERLEDDPEADWRDLSCDYPARSESPSDQVVPDRETADRLWQALEQEEDEDIRCQTAFCIVAMTPKADLARLLILLKDDDMYVQERVCERLGHERYAAAEEQLRELANNGFSNARSAAARALAQMNLRP